MLQQLLLQVVIVGMALGLCGDPLLKHNWRQVDGDLVRHTALLHTFFNLQNSGSNNSRVQGAQRVWGWPITGHMFTHLCYTVCTTATGQLYKELWI